MKLWIWTWALWCASVGGVRAVVLFPGASSCKTINTHVTCDLSNQHDRDATLGKTNNESAFTKWLVIGATSLVITEQCNAEDKELVVENSHAIHTVSGSSDLCRISLTLINSTAKDISHVASSLRLQDSTVGRIHFDQIDYFQLIGTSITGDLEIMAITNTSNIYNSSIYDLKRMVFDGNLRFTVELSNITCMRGFIYSSTHTHSTMDKLRIERVFPEGLVVHEGTLLINNITIGILDPNAFIIETGSEVKIQNSEIKSAVTDSIIMRGGSLEFINVTVGKQIGVSFNIRNVQFIKPLGFVLECSSSSQVWIVTGGILLFVFGILAGSGVVFLLVRKNMFLKIRDKERIELLTTDNSSSNKLQNSTSQAPQKDPTSKQQSPETPKEKHYQDFDNQKSKQHQKQGTVMEENYEMYDEINTPSQNETNNILHNIHRVLPSSPPNQLPTLFSGIQSPPLGPPLPTRGPPAPKEILHPANENEMQLKHCQLLPIKRDQPKTPQQSSNHDELDNLPPPPPPQDDLGDYDDTHGIQTESQQATTRPSVSSNKAASFLHTGNPPGAGLTSNMHGRPLLLKKPPPPPRTQKPTTSSGTLSDPEDELYEEI